MAIIDGLSDSQHFLKISTDAGTTFIKVPLLTNIDMIDQKNQSMKLPRLTRGTRKKRLSILLKSMIWHLSWYLNPLTLSTSN